MPATTIEIPKRRRKSPANPAFTEDQLNDFVKALGKVGEREAVVVDDAKDGNGKATSRARAAKLALAEDPYNLEVKAHSICTSEPDAEGNGGQFVPAISLKKSAE